jgi:sec-independent protein translocase protein TatA
VNLIMGGLSPIHWIIIAIAAILLFGGRGKISSVMGDAAKGVKAFRDGLKDDHETPPAAPAATPSLPPAQAEKDPSVH